MKIIALQHTRPRPPFLDDLIKNAGHEIIEISLIDADWANHFEDAAIFLLLNPDICLSTYVSSVSLWELFLQQRYPHCKLLVAGFQHIVHPNYLDLLSPENYHGSFFESLADMNNYQPISQLEGIYLMEKLHRFFAGHGQESVVAVLSRLRLIVQMATRETQKMGTPFEEVYEDLIKPSNLAAKWVEWKSRWVNYSPLFKHSPFFNVFCELEKQMATLESWMDEGGQKEGPILDGQILDVLNFTHQKLQEIEQDYVVKELSHTYR